MREIVGSLVRGAIIVVLCGVPLLVLAGLHALLGEFLPVLIACAVSIAAGFAMGRNLCINEMLDRAHRAEDALEGRSLREAEAYCAEEQQRVEFRVRRASELNDDLPPCDEAVRIKRRRVERTPATTNCPPGYSSYQQWFREGGGLGRKSARQRLLDVRGG